jgi:hypothetical protein
MAEKQALLDSKMSNLKNNYLDSDNITGEGTWNGFRNESMDMFKHPRGPHVPIPLVNIIEEFNPIVLHKVPETCDPLDGTLGPKWPLKTIQLGSSQRKDLATFEDFKTQFEISTHGFLKYVPWQETNSFLAGGLVEACLRSPEGTTPESNVLEGPRKYGDVDIFFYGMKSYEELVESSTTVTLSIIKAMKEAGIKDIKMERRTSSLTLYAKGETKEQRYKPVQLILQIEHPTSISHVLHKFDLDCCGHAYDGKRVYSTWKAVRAWAFQANVVDIEFLMASRRGGRLVSGGLNCESRLLKYGERGYAAAVPALDDTALAAAEAKAAEAIAAASHDRAFAVLDGLPLLLYMHDANISYTPAQDSPFKEYMVTKDNINDEAVLRKMVHALVEPPPNEPEREPAFLSLPGETALKFQKSWIAGKMSEHNLSFDF